MIILASVGKPRFNRGVHFRKAWDPWRQGQGQGQCGPTTSAAFGGSLRRSIDHTCTPEKYIAEQNNILKRTFDAYGALVFLARQPFVDAHRVVVVGSSQGGTVVLSVAEERTFELFINPGNLAFRGAIALYPWCIAAGARPAIPTLILVGELDDWTPAKGCVRKVAQWGSAGPPIELVTYPGAYHDFNLPDLQPGRKLFDHWLECNANAADDANRRIREFLTHQFGK
jgi:dienelactone hydrolase